MIKKIEDIISNFYDKLIRFIKENYKEITFIVLLYIISMWPVNYYIITGGGIMPVGNRIKVENSYEGKGSFNLAYVKEINGTVFSYLSSYVIKNWEREKISNYTYNDEETMEDVKFRGKVDLLSSNLNAIKNAYKEAGKTYISKGFEIYIYLVDPDSKNEFKVGDKILKAENKEIKTVDDYKEIVYNHKKGDKIDILVERNGKEKQITSTIMEKDNKLYTGIYIVQVENYKTYPKVEFNFKESESGPSGGLIETLDLYNKLTKKDITKGLKIAGTGEIDSEGNILEIGGVKYKLLGAAKQKADVFISPSGKNYETCKKVVKENKLKIKIIEVSTFKEALSKLNKLKK